MSNAKITEIFSSIQGEGKYAGVKQVFVRFFACNMQCSWCDTPSAKDDVQQDYLSIDIDKVFTRISELWDTCHSVSLTGGEPLLQKNFIKQLLPLMKKNHMPAYLETNGILFEELADIVEDIDIIAMDFKLPSSTRQKRYWKQHAEFLKTAVHAKVKDIFVKTVVSSDTDKRDMEQVVELIANINPAVFLILQPNTYELENGVLTKCLEYQNYCLKHLPDVRILPQVHKFMKVK